MGYKRLYLRKNVVPKAHSSIIREKEQVDVAMLESKEICNATSINKSESSSEIYVLDKSATWDHNYSKNNVNITIENNGSSTFDT